MMKDDARDEGGSFPVILHHIIWASCARDTEVMWDPIIAPRLWFLG
eukprot:CAMPEP_0206046292 /NCGR_PEP_ID=MMETSP1466-20131121/18248_1 /ASSEMBLY_ACC=CAM_ASM_001126 /TAXON_ID=44452 /ORGANISM="Pavlova gyrans, Strain CCMP608" /LENGTH=45 /DNA_ID= /DNA_START= /DNA_END= /DNA_ORIENTATION=